MNPVRSCLALSVALFLLACGGEDKGPRPEPSSCRPLTLTGADDPGSGPVDCGALDGLELYVIDDFELGTYHGGWYTNNDRTAIQEPPPDTEIPSAEIPGGRCVGAELSRDAPAVCDDYDAEPGSCRGQYRAESRRAIQIRSGYLSDGSGVVGRTFPKTCAPWSGAENEPFCPYKAPPQEFGPCSMGLGTSPPRAGCKGADFSGWEGVVVWLRKGPGSASGIRLRVSDGRTDDKGCGCNPYTNENDPSDGCDKYGTVATLTQDFEPYFFPFAAMQQDGWGKRAPGGVDASDVFEVAVDFMRGAWNLWVDDIALYRRKP